TRNLMVPCWAAAPPEASAAASAQISFFMVFPPLRSMLAFPRAMDTFRGIEAFVRVAETQSFAEAARQLCVAKSVVTTRVQQLEQFVSAALFHRTTRSVQIG